MLINSCGLNVPLEEGQSSTVGNPIINKSTDLWKVFYNWIKTINDGEMNVDVTKFMLYCNQSGQHGIVDEFSSPANKVDTTAAIEYAKNKLADIKNGHVIWKYFDYVVNHNENILLGFIERFELQIGDDAPQKKLVFI